jgi:hypothetical protein
MIQIAVFDFAGTLYKKDLFIEFNKFIIKKHPFRLLYLVLKDFYFVLFKVGIIPVTKAKELLLCYLNGTFTNYVRYYAQTFWQKEFPDNFHTTLLQKVNSLKQDGAKIFCISESIDIILSPIVSFIGIDSLIATNSTYSDYRTYKIIGGKLSWN